MAMAWTREETREGMRSGCVLKINGGKLEFADGLWDMG